MDKEESLLLCEELFEKGYVYRYQLNDFVALPGGGQPFSSPSRKVVCLAGEFIEELIQPVLQPVILSAAESDDLNRLALVWPKFMRAQLKFYFSAKAGRLEPSLARLVRLCCTEKEWEKAPRDPDFRFVQPFIRLDAVRTPEGFKVVDINSTRPAGVGDLILITRVMKEFFPGLSPFDTAGEFVRTVKECVEDWRKSYSFPGNGLAGILIRETDGDWHNFRILAEVLSQQGLSCGIFSPEDFPAQDLSLLIRSRIKEGDPLFPCLEEGYPDRRCLISPLYRRFLGNKLWMYLISVKGAKEFFERELGPDYDFFVSCLAEIGVVDKQGLLVLPQGTPQAVAKLSRKEWILKQPASSSGKKMIMGLFMSRGKWESLLGQAEAGWIGQRLYINPEEFNVLDKEGEFKTEKMFVKYGIFILGGKLAGVEVMCRRTPLVHGARNTYISPAFSPERIKNREG